MNKYIDGLTFIQKSTSGEKGDDPCKKKGKEGRYRGQGLLVPRLGLLEKAILAQEAVAIKSFYRGTTGCGGEEVVVSKRIHFA